MSMIRRIISELRTPDDQGRDWYGWCSNQMAHAFLGTLVAYAATAPLNGVAMALICGALKETLDLMQRPLALLSRASLVDSLADVSFWCFGAWIAVTQGDPVAVIMMAFALVCGVIPRLRAIQNAGG